jgi:hypothetical protein
LAERRLEKGRMYRIDRHDVAPDVPVDASVDEQLAYCQSHLIRVNAREGTFHVTAEGARTLEEEDIAPPDAGISFGPGWYRATRWSAAEAPSRWASQDAELVVEPPPDSGQVVFLDVEPGPSVGNRRFLLQVLNRADEVVAETEVPHRGVVAIKLPLRHGERQVFRFHTVGGGSPVFLNPHILNFRAFHCGWERPAERFAAFETGRHSSLMLRRPAAAANRRRRGWLAAEQDIVAAADGLMVGDGWYAPERHGRRAFRWARGGAELIVFNPAGPPCSLETRAQAGPAVGFEPCELKVRDWRGEVVAKAAIEKTPRLVRLVLPWRPGQAQVFTLEVEGGGAPVPAPNDPRILEFRLFGCRWVADSRAPAHSKPTCWDFESNKAFDVARPDAGFYWGDGWGPPQCSANGGTFRWARNDAVLVVRAPQEPPGALRLEIEPGPGLGFGIFQLRLLDPGGREVATGLVRGRKMLHLRLQPPLRAGRTHLFTLRAEPSDPAATGDPELPSFRVYHCGWPEPPEDIVPPLRRSGGLALSKGWYPVERAGDVVFRWAANNAEIIALDPEAQMGRLDLELEPGPSQGNRPFVLQILNASWQAVYEATVIGRQSLRICLPMQPGRSCLYRLHADGADLPVPGDRRTLSFRVFRCAWAPTVRGRFSLRTDGPWDGSGGPTPLPAFLPAGLEDEEILSAVNLHTNACGDFTLMAREHWLALRGYPEFDAFSFNLDSVLCFAAHHGGAPEQMLQDPKRIYHIEHATGSGWTPEGHARLFERIHAKGIPCVDDREVFGWALQMRRLQAPMIFNGEDWGLASLDLQETDPAAKTEVHGAPK